MHFNEFSRICEMMMSNILRHTQSFYWFLNNNSSILSIFIWNGQSRLSPNYHKIVIYFNSLNDLGKLMRRNSIILYFYENVRLSGYKNTTQLVWYKCVFEKLDFSSRMAKIFINRYKRARGSTLLERCFSFNGTSQAKPSPGVIINDS